jgi:predicted nucleic acid-binding Zn ribbon protein
MKKPLPSASSRRADIIPLKEGLVASWERVMGKAVAQKTKEVYVSKGKLFVRLTSAPLKHELVMAKTRVLELLNSEVGAQVVTEVIFL